MKGTKIIFVCRECGTTSPKWLGRCPDCNTWNSFDEEQVIDKTQKSKAEYLEEQYEEDEEEVKIVRSKRYDLKPMYPEDACIQMELLGHDFFVFVNAETDEVNVVYKRKANTYGIIEPE